MVLQKNVLFSGTIAENLRWGDPNATDEEVREAAHLACADEFVDGFPKGYDTWIERGGSNVSGGQKQRLCIARALLRRPKILILDDSTSAVDTKTDAKIREGLASYLPNTTKLIIAQRISSVQDADRIIVMEGGRIKDIGNHDELLKTSEIYRETFTSQNKMSAEGEDAGETAAADTEHPHRKLRPRKEARHMSKAATAERARSRKGGTMTRLIKMLFGFYPVLLPLVVAGVVLCAIINSIGATFLQSALQVISESWQSGDWTAAQPKILKLVTTLGCIYAVGVASSLFWNRAMAVITQGSLEKLREKMFNRMQDLPIRYFDTHQRGDIMSHYTNDIDTLRQMISQSLPNLLMTIIVIVTVFFIMLYYSVWMCLVIIAGIAL